MPKQEKPTEIIKQQVSFYFMMQLSGRESYAFICESPGQRRKGWMRVEPLLNY